MVSGGIRGPMGMPRPLCNCEQQLVFELEGRAQGDIDEDAIESELDSSLNTDVSVSTRAGRFDANQELVVALGTGIVLEETFRDAERIVNSQLIQQTVGFTISEWRIEA